MASKWITRQTVDLTRETVTGRAGALAMSGDAQGHEWVVTLRDGDMDAVPGERAAQAFFTRADGVTILVEGTITGNTVRVTMPRDAMLVAGRLLGVLRLGDSVTVESDPVITVAKCEWFVDQGIEGEIASPSETFHTITELAEAVDGMESSVSAHTTQIAALDGRVGTLEDIVVSDGWQDMGNASGISAGTANMGMYTGHICAYRVENGNHVIAHAHVALRFTYNSQGATRLNSISIPANLQPTTRVVRVCPVNGPERVCRAYVTGGDIYIESVYEGNTRMTPVDVLWTDILIDWYIVPTE